MCDLMQEKQHIPLSNNTLACGLVHCILLQRREGGREAGREAERGRGGGMEGAGLLPTSICMSSPEKMLH